MLQYSNFYYTFIRIFKKREAENPHKHDTSYYIIFELFEITNSIRRRQK